MELPPWETTCTVLAAMTGPCVSRRARSSVPGGTAGNQSPTCTVGDQLMNCATLMECSLALEEMMGLHL